MKDGVCFSPAASASLDVSGMSGNTLELDRLYYKFPVGFRLQAIVGPMARNTESLGMKPTAYTVKTLNMFGGQFGAGNVYNKETGGLVGVIWKQKVAKGEPYLTAALNYVADDGEQASSPKGHVHRQIQRQHHCSDWLRHQAVGRCSRLPLRPVWCWVRHRL